MSLEEKLWRDQQKATKARDRFRLTVIRMLRAELKNAAIAKKAPLDEAEELAVLNREFKRRQESLADYRRAGRPELVEQLEQEMALIKSYLPEQLTEEELAEMVRQAIQESGAASMKDLGKVMRLLMPRVKGRADGNRVRQAVEEQISQL
ncbi:MAG TPA: GatB/YqeY domain-containing protein [Bacillota bacterium]|jgi:uncharacterized protein YqeY|nr:GatB/YqeY domain-containing protein [Bacillota bacterium]HOB87590.1 GatB/YqeY domain-containing protein [Bacillota bacterium]HOP69453.1 GatB/YqeY domain-containing protein [Bacillota bacterium]HPT34441.1 GatB/YqeY domain-containing protein [Bacillota bacterium]HQD06421.1 GatB/YqeY domain-containing protein [Bacillota bacterium]